MLQDDLTSVFILSAIVTFVAWKKKFYEISSPGISFFRLPSKYPLIAFAIYFLGMMLLGPFVYFSIKGTPLFKFSIAWTQVLTLLGIFGLFVLYIGLMKKAYRNYIFTGKIQATSLFENFGKNLGLGIISWVVSYPIVLLINLIMQKLSWALWQVKGVNQVAVEMLKKTKEDPLLFASLGFLVIVIVPFLEELIFRGFLQTFLRQYLGRWKALMLTALIFSFCHYASAQGIGNVELIVTLFALAMYLGFLYERQKNLWASYGLHMTFNAISVFMLIF